MRETNLWGESVAQVCTRFLRDALKEAPSGERFAYGRDRAASCIRIFGKPDEQDLRDFYVRVHAYFSEG